MNVRDKITELMAEGTHDSLLHALAMVLGLSFRTNVIIICKENGITPEQLLEKQAELTKELKSFLSGDDAKDLAKVLPGHKGDTRSMAKVSEEVDAAVKVMSQQIVHRVFGVPLVN